MKFDQLPIVGVSKQTDLRWAGKEFCDWNDLQSTSNFFEVHLLYIQIIICIAQNHTFAWLICTNATSSLDIGSEDKQLFDRE